MAQVTAVGSQGPNGSLTDDGGVGTSRSGESIASDGAVVDTPPADADTSDDSWTAPDVGAARRSGEPGAGRHHLRRSTRRRARTPISPYIYGVNDGIAGRPPPTRPSCARAATG